MGGSNSTQTFFSAWDNLAHLLCISYALAWASALPRDPPLNPSPSWVGRLSLCSQRSQHLLHVLVVENYWFKHLPPSLTYKLLEGRHRIWYVSAFSIA